MTGGAVVGGRLPTADGGSVEATVEWSGSTITSVTPVDPAAPVVDAGAGGAVVDARGALVLPGIVDLHGDAFERALMPRPGVRFPVSLALRETYGQLVAAGITTAFVSATDSWEPGLRSRRTLHELVEGLTTDPGPIDARLHVRHEVCNVAAVEQLEGWLADGTIDLLSFNDHTPGGTAPEHVDRAVGQMRQRAMVDAETLDAAVVTAVASRAAGRAQVVGLAERARGRGVPIASHDPATEADVDRDLRLGVKITEFPATVELARTYRARGIAVLLGAPNVVRGGSHLGLLTVADAVEARAVDVLCSDYHYPSLLQAPFEIARRGLRTLADAWTMVSANPAAVAGLVDRGRLDAGRRADLVVVDDDGRSPVRLRAVVAAGRVVHRSERVDGAEAAR